MADDLKRQLRDWRRAMYNTGWVHLADAMEAVAHHIEELEAELHLMKTSGIVEVAVRNPSVLEYIKHWEGRAETAEAKLAKAVTRMQHIAANKTTDELTRIEWDTHDTFTILDACILSARTTLAELKGQNDD